MNEWTKADLVGMKLCIHGERLRSCPVCGLMRNVAIALHPDAPGPATGTAGLKAGVLQPLPPAMGRLPQPEMNRTELRYSQYLDIIKLSGEIVYWGFEVLTVKLGTDLRFTPDFLVMYPSGRLEFHDTKGAKKIKAGRRAGETKPYVKDDALVKARVTAAHFIIPMYFVWPETNGTWGKKEL